MGDSKKMTHIISFCRAAYINVVEKIYLALTTDNKIAGRTSSALISPLISLEKNEEERKRGGEGEGGEERSLIRTPQKYTRCRCETCAYEK